MFKILYRVLSLLKNRKLLSGILVFANLLFAIFILVEPIFFKKVIDILSTFTQESTGILLYTLLFWLLVGLLIIVIRLFISIYSDRMSHEEWNSSIFSFFQHTLNLSMKFYSNSNSGELVKKITKGTDGIFYTQLEFFRKVLPELLTIILLIPLVLFLNWKLGILVIFFGIFTAYIAFYSISQTFYKQDNIEKYYNEMSFLYGDVYSNINIVKSFSLLPMKLNNLNRLLKIRLQKQYPILKWWGFLMSFGKIIHIIIGMGVIFFGSYLFLQGEISLGGVVMFLGFSNILLNSIENLMWALESVFWKTAAIKDFFKIVDIQADIQDIENAKNLKDVTGNIYFENVTFSYDDKREVIKNINFKVAAGEKIAFVGHTGSGKTTITNLLLRFYEPQSGKIFIDDIDISHVTQESLRKNIGVVFQENSMFNTTVLNNIRLDNKKASRKDIERVAIKSHAYDFIKNLTNGFDTIVGERGVKLSGGEKQRLALARAFLKDAPILILDEATSALDAETEKYLQASLEELMQERTTFIIAHRLSTIRNADRIFVLKNGKIAESGTYNDLFKKGGLFTKLVEAQVGGFVE